MNAKASRTVDRGYAAKTLSEWVAVYAARGIELNLNTLRRKRVAAGVGTLVPPNVYILTEAEFKKVVNATVPWTDEDRERRRRRVERRKGA